MTHRTLILLALGIACPSAARAEGYVSGGVLTGGNDGFFAAGGTLEAAVAFAPGWSLHGEVAGGGASKVEFLGHTTTSSSSFWQARGGVEYAHRFERASRPGSLSMGVDAGRQAITWSGTKTGLFGGEPYPDANRRVVAVLVPRVGWQAGNDRVRFHAGLEAAFDVRGWNGLDLGLGVGCHW